MTTTYTFVKEPQEGERFARQGRQILEMIKKQGSIEYTALKEKLTKAILDGDIVSRQDAKRLLSFYRKPFLANGYVTIETVKAEKPKKEKVAKEPKAPKAKKEKVAA